MNNTILSNNTIYIDEIVPGVWRYTSDKITYTNINIYPIILTGNIVNFESNLTISSSNHYFMIGANGIIIDGKFNNILSQNEINFSYGGLIGNYYIGTPNYSYTNVTVKNIKNYSNVILDDYCGFIIRQNFGYSGNSTIEHIYNYSEIPDKCGGVCGTLDLSKLSTLNIIIKNCLNYGNINTNSAGIVQSLNYGLLLNCHNLGNFIGNYVSGIANFKDPKGSMPNAYSPASCIICRCSNQTEISGDYCNGIAKITSDIIHEEIVISDCFNTGTISGDKCSGIITYSYTVDQRDEFGNFSASNLVRYCYNNGNILGNNSCGILYIDNVNSEYAYRFDITRCYNSGSITEITQAGFILGENMDYYSYTIVSDSYSYSPQFNNLGIDNSFIQNLAILTENSFISGTWDVNNGAYRTIGGLFNNTFLYQINYNGNNYNNYNIDFNEDQYSLLTSNNKYNYIDVSIVNENGVITHYRPFKLITFNFNSFLNNVNVNLNINNKLTHSSNRYFNILPPFGSYEIVTSTFLDKNNNILYSKFGNINNSLIIFDIDKLKSQMSGQMIIYHKNTLKNGPNNFNESYVISKILINNLLEYIPPPPLYNFYNTNRNLNYKFIPAFKDKENNPSNSSLWRINDSSSTEETFELFKRDSLDNYLNYSKYSINSERYSFNIIRNGYIQSGGNFKIIKLKVIMNSCLEKYIRLESIGINTNKNSIGNFAGATDGTHSYSHTKYLLTREKDGTYYLNNLVEGELVIDTDNSDDDLFSFWGNVVSSFDIYSQFTQVKIHNALYDTVLFNLELEGEYINPHLSFSNNNILSSVNVLTYSDYLISIYEYKKTIDIFELDDGNTAINKISPNQIANLQITKITNSKFRFGNGTNDIYKIRKYEITSGFLLNADISAFSNSPSINIKKLRVKRGELVAKVQKNSDLVIYDIFYIEIHKDDVKLLPNPTSNLVYIISNPTSQNDLKIFNTNNLHY